MSITAIIPFRARDGREHLLEVVTEHLAEIVDDIIVCDDEGETFSRAASINKGAAEANSDLLLICDADLIVPHEQIEKAAELAAEGMVIPFTELVSLNRDATAMVMRGADPAGQRGKITEAGSGGACMIDTITFDAAGGFDSRFRGWGYESDAFLAAVETLVDPARRLEGQAFHLNHPDEKFRPDQNWMLWERYENARLDLVGMRHIILGGDDE